MSRIPTSRIPALASALVLAGWISGAAMALAGPPPAPVQGAPATVVMADVPLPVSRPLRVSQTGPAAKALSLRVTGDAAGEGGETGRRLEASALKSGSIEALAVQLSGAKVLSSDGTVVGDVEKVIGGYGAGPQAVLAVGGFLGIGERRVVVPADSLVPSGKGAVRSELTEAQLRSLPEYIE